MTSVPGMLIAAILLGIVEHHRDVLRPVVGAGCRVRLITLAVRPAGLARR